MAIAKKAGCEETIEERSLEKDMVLVLGASRWQLDIIKRASALGLRTLATDISADAPGRAVADDFVQIDTNDREGLVQIARQRGIRFVIAEQTDRVVPVAAFINERLQLPGIKPASARLFTDKHAMRNALAGKGIAMPAYAEVSTANEAIEAARTWGYPSILKPKESQSSLGVFKVDSDQEVRDHFEATLSHSRDQRVLIEEFIPGTEITVEGFSLKGRAYALAVSEKYHYTFNPCVARRLAYPPRFSDEVMNKIKVNAERVVDTLGLEDGISHAEYRLREGVPYLVEVAARGGGNRIASLIVEHVSGWDVYDMLLRRLLREEVKVAPRQNRAANLEFLDFEPGRVKAVRGLEQVRAEKLVHDIELHFQPGDEIGQARDDRTRQGYFITLGDSRDEIDEKSARVKQILKIEYE